MKKKTVLTAAQKGWLQQPLSANDKKLKSWKTWNNLYLSKITFYLFRTDRWWFKNAHQTWQKAIQRGRQPDDWNSKLPYAQSNHCGNPKKILAHNVSFQIVTRPCKRLFLLSAHIYKMERKSSTRSGAFFTFTWQLKKPECPCSAEGRKWRFWMWNLNHQIIANLLKNANEIVIFKKKKRTEIGFFSER